MNLDSGSFEWISPLKHIVFWIKLCWEFQLDVSHNFDKSIKNRTE